ncbi:MAG: acetyl-CoA carboxylase, carboxyltransferase subunit beta [Candidatus Kryptonium sp.]|nr:acetyl-CoA carboxylase, carboxyltransferase subunit beta [Candidatus Kryptonium sp.]MCX7763258.1 acetyl-CoA carboxylase, carboxyltransferase subunit beta [Candidatus Kryptonium sp.]MDW8109145.1 acetyl-CoA carboxylase, carboxyltransferase subunit beta [Candidatus Kryptonium sp.]
MSWFKRLTKNISGEKKELPEGLWTKCEQCGEIIHKSQLELNLWTCHKCNYHFRISSYDYINILIDSGTFKEFDKKIRSVDVLNFTDTKPYSERLKEAMKKTGLNEAIVTGTGKINGIPVVIAVMDFRFIGGSMGSVVGEKVARAIEKSLKTKHPLIIVSSSGGARMMEGALSLMQLAKTSAMLTKLSSAGIPYISVLTDPTTGGVTASYAMLGDINIAEPGALIGFAGPRVIKQATGKDLPEGFQKAEFLLEHGFIDLIAHRKELKGKISQILRLLLEK